MNTTTPDTAHAWPLRQVRWLLIRMFINTDAQGRLRDARCAEAVVRRGEEQPCEKPAVAMRYDTRDDPPSPYEVCARHSRAPMVTLADLLAAATGPAE